MAKKKDCLLKKQHSEQVNSELKTQQQETANNVIAPTMAREQ